MPAYRRWRAAGGCYFFTVNLADRRRRLLVEHIDALRAAFDRERGRRPFTIEAAVILPDHLHCIWSLPAGDDDFSIRWAMIKKAFSRSLADTEPRSASRRRRGERGVWQRRFWEHLIRDEEDFERHADYIHWNPVKHGLANRPADWPHSSIHRFIKTGVMDVSWGTAGPPANMIDVEHDR